MLGEKYGTETTGTEYGKNPVLAEQNNFFYAKSAPFIVWQIRIHAYVYNMKKCSLTIAFRQFIKI